MQSDAMNRFRKLLEASPPDFVSRVDDPWTAVPDYADFNAAAYRHIVRDLGRLGRGGANNQRPSRGILVLGEAGTGKTHLLMRVAHTLAKENHILFVRRPNDEESVAQHIWADILRSLDRELPTSGKQRSQLDDLLAHVFSRVLTLEFDDAAPSGGAARQPSWVPRLRKDPFYLFEVLGEGENRTKNMRHLRSLTLKFLQQHHPDVDQQIAYALISYCFVSRDERRRVFLSWLSGQDIDEREAQAMGMPPSWVAADDASSDESMQQRREGRALRAIQTIGILSTHYQPLILAFDQLEGLRGEERLTRRWGDAVREIFTMAPNLLIVTCTFPSLWETWFQPRLDASASERIAEKQILLERFEPRHGISLLEKHLERVATQSDLPSGIYPFTEGDVAAMCREARSPRQFLQEAKAAFDNWLDDDAFSSCPVDLPGVLPKATTERIDEVLGAAVAKFEDEQRRAYAKEITTEHDFFGRIRFLLEALLRGVRATVSEAHWGHFVMPRNMVVRARTYGDALCVAVSNGNGRAFTSRLGNLVSAQQEADQFSAAILLRDCRSSAPTELGSQRLEEFKSRKGEFLSVGIEEYVLLNALYDTLVAVAEHNISLGSYEATEADFVRFVARSGIGRRSQLLRLVAKSATCFQQALAAPAEAPITASAEQDGGDDTDGMEPFAFVERLVDSADDCGDLSEPAGEVWPAVLPAYGGRRNAAAECEAVAVMSAPARRPTAIASPAASPARPAAEQLAPAAKSGPDCQAVIGDSELDCAHVGVLGELRDGKNTLGISLSTPQCMVLLGYMGSGKSYALGVLIENALLPSSALVRSPRPLSVVAFNYKHNSAAKFEYCGFAQPNSRDNEVDVLRKKYGAEPGATGTVNVFGYGPELQRRQKEYQGLPTYPIQFRAEELGAEHWSILMKPPGSQSEYMNVVKDIIQDLYYQERLTYKNLERNIQSTERLTESQRKKALNRLLFAKKWLADDRSYEWSDVLREGSLNIVDLRVQTLGSDEALKLCLVITDLVRKTRNGVNKMIVFDEAHEYVDCKELIGELENAITQIRHDGLSFVLASQFPERIPETIFKYLVTRLVFKLPTAKAVNYLRKVASNLKVLSLDQVANLGLEKGICFVQTDHDCTDATLRSPQVLEIRPRASQHGGATVKQL